MSNQGMPPRPKKSRLELLGELSKRGYIDKQKLHEACGIDLSDEEGAQRIGVSADQVGKAMAHSYASELQALQASSLQQQGMSPQLGRVASGDPIDEEVDMAPGSMARRIADVAVEQAKHEMEKEDTLLSEMCELLHQRLQILEERDRNQVKHAQALMKENHRLRRQNLRLTDLVLEKLGVRCESDEDESIGCEASEDGQGQGSEGRGPRGSEEEEP